MADHIDDVLFKQKAVVEFLTKEGVGAKNIADRLKTVYGEQCLSYRSVARWVAHFKTGATDISDKPRSGRPRSAVTPQNKTRVNEMIQNDRRVTVMDIMHEIGIGNSAVQDIICELGYR